MDVDRGAERGGGLEDRPVVGVVEVALAGSAEEQRAVQAERDDRALELLCGRRGRRGCERREALEPVRMGVHELGDAVVCLDLQMRGLGGRKVVQTGRGERDHLNIQARLVHRRDPALPDLAEPLPDVPLGRAGPRVRSRGGGEAAPGRQDLVGHEMLLSSDRLHAAGLLSNPRPSSCRAPETSCRSGGSCRERARRSRHHEWAGPTRYGRRPPGPPHFGARVAPIVE